MRFVIEPSRLVTLPKAAAEPPETKDSAEV